jgi:hypothetical protein
MMRGLLKRWWPALFGSALAFGATAALAISPEDQESLRKDCIRPYVWGGFETRDGVYEAAETHLGEPDLKDTEIAWIKTEIEREWSEKKKAEASWPATTDFDRLDAVFKALDSSGILALHYAGNTQDEAHSDAGQTWQDRGGSQSGLRGFVFYHSQDVEHVLADGQLYIGFGIFEGADGKAIEIARIAGEALAAAGFKVTMPADEGQRILVTGIDWKKRSPN